MRRENLLESLVEEALIKYGDRAYYVLKAAVEVAEENRVASKSLPGDFDFKSLIRRLSSWGISYNPSILLKRLERDYGIIELSYKSSTQKWWVITDLETLKKVLRRYRGSDGDVGEPERLLLSLKVKLLGVDSVLERVRKLVAKDVLTERDKEKLIDIVFRYMPKVVEVMKEAENYGGEFREFVRKAKELLRLLEVAVNKYVGTDSRVVSTLKASLRTSISEEL